MIREFRHVERAGSLGDGHQELEMFVQSCGQLECEPQILSHRLLPQMYEDGGGGELLHTAG